MNYYNPYLNYPYANNGMQQFNSPINQFTPQVPQMAQQQINPQPQMNVLNGKIVDSEDIVKATEVPIGGYGVFPKADLSEIYVKSWNNNGTTSVITYQPVVTSTPQSDKTLPDSSIILQLFQKMENVENKLDTFMQTQKTPATAQEKEGILSGL